MTRDSLDFIAVMCIGGLFMYVFTLVVRSWLDHSPKPLNDHRELMKELKRHSGKENDEP